MNAHMLRYIATACILIFTVNSPQLWAGNRATVELLPAVNTVAPGQIFEAALQFKIEEGWHIYWKNAGDSGMAPRVTWHLPAGFEAGPLQFPIPKRHVGRASLVTNIHEGETAILLTVTPSKDASPGNQVQLAADLKWLICAESCIQETQSVKIELPVVSSADQVQPANEAFFKQARKKLPVAGPKGKFVTIAARVAEGRLSPSATIKIALDVEIRTGFHIQSDKPRIKGLIATDVFVGPADGLFFDPPQFPTPKTRDVPKIGQVDEFEKNITITIPVEAEDELPGDSRVIDGVFVYQACDDKTGTCYPQEGVSWNLTVPIGLAFDLPDGQAHVSAPVAEPNSLPEPNDVQDPNGLPDTVARQENFSAGDDDWLAGFIGQYGTLGLLVLCFIYGLGLNLTPCVLPLLSIKVLGFVRQAHESRRRTFALALAFGAGVLPLFVVLGFLAAQGSNVLQMPAVVIGLSAVVLAMALSMLGVFTLHVPSVAVNLDAKIRKESLISWFGKGSLAPVLGFACTGPFLAGAFGLATKQPNQTAFLSFVAMGLGMACPYVLLGANPNWLKFVPRPGQWMITFERLMGFLLLATVIWLVNPLIQLIGPAGLQWTWVFFVAVGMGCWLLGRIDYSMSASSRNMRRIGALAVVTIVGVLVYGWIYPLGPAKERQRAMVHQRPAVDGSFATSSLQSWEDDLPWQPWSPAAVANAVEQGHTVFVDFTAAYCTVCKANKALAINTPEVRQKMKEMGVVALQGDFTFEDEDVFATLQRHGRAGVPLDLIYRPCHPDQPIVLRTNLTKEYLLQKLDEAGPSLKTCAQAPIPITDSDRLLTSSS